MVPRVVNKTFRRRLGLRANQLRALEICDATVRSYVGRARSDSYLKHRHSNHNADDENVTGHQTEARRWPRHRRRPDQAEACVVIIAPSRYRQDCGQGSLAGGGLLTKEAVSHSAASNRDVRFTPENGHGVASIEANIACTFMSARPKEISLCLENPVTYLLA